MHFSRRQLMTSGMALAAFATVPWRAAWGAAGKSMVARAEPVKDTLFGVTLTDPYRWMESPKDPDWLPYLKSRSEETRSVFDSMPGRKALADRIMALAGEQVAVARIAEAGGRTFYQQRPRGANIPKLFVKEGQGEARVLIDPETMKAADGSHISLDWWQASPDGKWVAYGLSPAGSEESIGHIMSVDTGAVLPERIQKAGRGVTAWLPDASGFFYIQLTGERGNPNYYLDAQLRLHRLRTDPATDPLILQRGKAGEIVTETIQTPVVVAQPGSDMAIAALIAGSRPDIALYSAPLADVVAGRARWAKITGYEDGVTTGALVGNDMYLVSYKDAERGRVLRVDPRRPDLASAQVVLPESELVIEETIAVRDGLYVTLMDGGVRRLKKIGAGGRVTDIALPDGTSVAWVDGTPSSPAFVNVAGWTTPPTLYQATVNGQLVDTGLIPRPPIDVSPYTSRRIFATAKDGTRVPITVMMRKDTPKDGKRPLLAEAYGAYRNAITPNFDARRLAFLDQGGVHAYAHVRGGGEYGRAWHEAGKRATKANTWRDFIVCCETLIAEGWTSPKQLTIKGTSAGGVAVGRAMTERPDLFAGAINDVGFVNPLRYVAEQNSDGDTPEFGAVTDEAGFKGLLAMDAYQSVKDGIKYPALLGVTGVNDPRLAPFHVAKFDARVRAASTSGNPVLLRVEFDAGHGVGSTRTQRDQLFADMFSFVLWRAGVPAFQPGVSV
jgi:prolyl oligopeptidase